MANPLELSARKKAVFTHNHCCMCDANSWVSDKVVYTQETQKLHEFGQKGGRNPI